MFWDCKSLTNIIIPNKVTVIDEHSFIGCSGLVSIVVPTSVSFINDGAFHDCSGLTDIYYMGEENEWISIDVSSKYNDSFINAIIHYNYVLKK